MSTQDIDFTVIIPQRNSLETLPRLFDSIPVSKRIEIILVDNTPIPVTKDEIGINRDYELLWSAPERHAGGARNVGIENAHGKWLLFADADDFYPADAFDTFYSMLNTDADVVYYGANGIYLDTGKPSDRGDRYTIAVRKYLSGETDEYSLRIGLDTPWCKMVRKSLVDKYSIRFDEVRASNDSFFALLVGYYATKITAVDHIVYTATVGRGSLTRSRDFEVLNSRFEVNLRYNKFLKEHGFPDRQKSVALYIYQARAFGISKMLKMIVRAISVRQSLFINSGNWLASYKAHKDKEKREASYLTKKYTRHISEL